MPPYGGSIAQNVYYADSDLCDDNVDPSGGYPKRDMANGKMKPWESPFILMMDRGGCTFVKKVRNAQRAGASGVIIADNTCLCSDEACMRDSDQTTCETTEPIMADDGSGGDISIPSFLMFKRDADKIKDEVLQNHPVQIEMSWKLPTPDDRVEYDLWTVPKAENSKDFLLKFKKLAMALGEHAYFTPHMYIYDGIRSHCQGNDGENFCYNLCTNNGRYCATDPDNDLEQGISGADVIRESLRRLCIWKNYGNEDGIGEKWWDYIAEFTARCDEPDYFMNEDCVKDAYKHASIDASLIDRCIQDSGGLEKDSINAFLDKEISAQVQRGVVVIPTVFVNTAALRGALTPSNVFAAICSGFSEGTAPDVCKKCGKCHDAPTCVDKGYCSAEAGGAGGPQDSVSTRTFGFSMFVVIGAFVGLGAWHYKRTREDMRDQVRGILAEYMPLDDGGDGGGGGHPGNPMDFARGGASTSLIS
jgi:hypothetical protein